MKLEYNILWIDNDLQGYIENGEVKDIEDFLTDNGFEPNIEKVFDEADLDQFIDKHDYDLIISDFNLENTTGGRVIERIRTEKQLDTEILFYTAQNENSQEFNNEVKSLAFIERLTFQQGRERLMDKIEKVINLTLKKLLELNATRGLITAATSGLDVEIEESYDLLINLPSDQKLVPKIEKIFKTDYKEIKKALLKKCKSQRDCHTNDYKLYFSQSDAFRKWDILKELLSLNIPIGFDLTLFKRYKEEVIDIRNKFAHARAENNNGTLVLKGQLGREDFEFDNSACIQIRKNIISHKNNIKVLKKILTSS